MKNIYDIIAINEFTYNIKIHGENVTPIYQTIMKMLNSTHYNSDTHSIDFSAEHVIPFKQYLTTHKINFNVCIKMIDELTKQILFLKKINYGFYGIDINDILIIDNKFIFCSAQNILPIVNNAFIFYAPINRPYFSNPEILELTTLPAEINYKCVYYSLGALVVFCLFNKYLLVGNEIKDTKEIDTILSPINNTKLYWFLKRCLTEQIDKRVLLLI
jgi:hypothetical protein